MLKQPVCIKILRPNPERRGTIRSWRPSLRPSVQELGLGKARRPSPAGEQSKPAKKNICRHLDISQGLAAVEARPQTAAELPQPYCSYHTATSYCHYVWVLLELKGSTGKCRQHWLTTVSRLQGQLGVSHWRLDAGHWHQRGTSRVKGKGEPSTVSPMQHRGSLKRSMESDMYVTNQTQSGVWSWSYSSLKHLKLTFCSFSMLQPKRMYTVHIYYLFAIDGAV